MTPTAYTLSRRDKLLGVDNISVKIVRSSSDADRCGSWVGTRADSRGAMSAWRGCTRGCIRTTDDDICELRPCDAQAALVSGPRPSNSPGHAHNESDRKYIV